MKISRMNKGEWGKVRAFFDLETEEGFNIKGFKVVQGVDGLFVGFPSQKDKEGEYYDSVLADKTLKQMLNKLALEYYSRVGSSKSDEDDLPF